MSAPLPTPPPEASKTLTIGAVCRQLGEEFPDISISKIRYLEDQKLLAPRRTQGGYRLYSPADVERLRTILRLQRDEFLPLRVIRQELAEDESPGERRAGRRRRPVLSAARAEPSAVTREELIAETGADEEFLRELEDFGIVAAAPGANGAYRPSEAQIVRICLQMANFGLGPRHLRQYRLAVQRAAGMLESVLAPALRSRNADRRESGLEDLAVLAGLTSDLTERILLRDVGGLPGAP